MTGQYRELFFEHNGRGVVQGRIILHNEPESIICVG